MAERRLLSELARLHRREPLRGDVRIDTLVEAVRTAPRGVATSHRGGTPLVLGDRALMAVIDDLAAAGRIVRRGRRVRLPGHRPGLEPEMRTRVDRLIAGLREAGASPPRIEGLAARLGIPAGVVAQLRAGGELIPIAPGIDLPRETWDEVSQRVDRLAASGPLNVVRVRDGLRVSRRHAEAILAYRRAQRGRLRTRGRAG